MDLKNTFIGGRMNKDDDERLLQSNEYRHAENILVVNSEGGDVGAIENERSNKRLTTLELGSNIKTITPNLCVNKVRNKIYWMVKSNTGCYLLEYNADNGFTTFVLADTRAVNERVFNLSEFYLITGIEILIGETEDEDLMLWTDDNMQPCCINIERAKTYGENGFVKEDIYLIKKPPKQAPRTLQINSTKPSNYLEEKFALFAYRYQYLDGEYSALSSYSYYNFSPKPFQIDFLTGENLGMVNNFNTVNIFFNTGESQVTKIEIIAKISNSNALYKIESFDKELEGWSDNEERFISFNNNKIYTILPETESLRYFDNVPLKAKALTLIENRPVFGNYVEGQNLINQFGGKIKPNLIASFNSYEIAEVEIDSEVVNILPPFTPSSRFNIDFTGESLIEGKRLIFNIRLSNEFYTGVFNNIFEYILLEDYPNITSLASDNDFIHFIENVWTSVFTNNYTIDVPGGYVLNSITGFTIQSAVGNVLSINQPLLHYTNNVPESEQVRFRFTTGTEAYYSSTSNIRTMKSNRDYEIGIVYKDEFQRATTVLNSPNNSVFIPIENSVTQNKLVVRIGHLPPIFANTYKIVVKAQPLNYQIIYVNQFFEDGVFRWIKLEGENKDKVKEGDILILKSDRLGTASTVIKTKVLEAGAQEADFILDNADIGGTEIKEPAGFYIKIRPIGFSMNYDPDEFFESESNTKVYDGRPKSYADLFSFKEVEESDEWTNRALSAGSTITLYFKNYERSDGDARFERTYTLQTNYDDFDAWFDDVIVGTNLTAENGDVFENVAIRRGFATKIILGGISYYDFVEDLVNGKLYLEVGGIYAGNTGNRRSFLDVKVTLRSVSGIFVFETETRNAEQEFYYESEETFEIINGAHQGNIQNQGAIIPNTKIPPAIIELDFFNAYSFGNGVESYQIKDSQLKEYLNIDMKPSIVQVNEYKQIRRFADKCFGGTYNEGFNAVNEFLVHNIKQLDKQYGSIQRLVSRNTNILVFQEFKTSYVLYGKNTISTATGTDVITKDAQVLGEQVPYAGENGIGTKPESLSNDDYRYYFANPTRGSVIRLSMDGTEDINTKMVDWFRDMFQNNPFGVTIGGYDSHHRQYVIHFKAGTRPPIIPKFGVPIIFTDTEEISYYMIITEVFDEIYVDYTVETGEIDISVDFDGDSEVYEGLTGNGTITVPTGQIGTLTVVITSEALATFTINNRRSENPILKLKLLTIGDEYVSGNSITNQYEWMGAGREFSTNIFFDALPWVYYTQLEGKEGEGQIPLNGSNIEIASYKSSTDNLNFDEEFFIGYLVTETEYGISDADIEEMIGNATFVSLTTEELTENTFIKSGIFNFNRTNNNQILYLIWDYRRIESESGGESGSIESEESEILLD